MTREVGNIQIYLHVSSWCLVLHPFSPHSRCGLLEFLSGVRHEPTLNYPKNEFQSRVFKINSCPVIRPFILVTDLWRRATSLSFLLSDSQQQSSRLHAHIPLRAQITSCRRCNLQANEGRAGKYLWIKYRMKEKQKMLTVSCVCFGGYNNGFIAP